MRVSKEEGVLILSREDLAEMVGFYVSEGVGGKDLDGVALLVDTEGENFYKRFPDCEIYIDITEHS